VEPTQSAPPLQTSSTKIATLQRVLQGLHFSSVNSVARKSKSLLFLRVSGIVLVGMVISLLVVCSYYLKRGYQRFNRDLEYARYFTLLLLGVQVASLLVSFIQFLLLFCGFALQMCWVKHSNDDSTSVDALQKFKESFIRNNSEATITDNFGTSDLETLRSWIKPSHGWAGDYLRFKDIMRVYYYTSLVAIVLSSVGFGIYLR
jgi:succinate dehydrogenase hydrophobic anchor subunit